MIILNCMIMNIYLCIQKRHEPHVVLIAGSKARKFTFEIAQILTNITEKGEIDAINCNPAKERYLLDEEIVAALQKPSNTIILNGSDNFLNGIHIIEL